MNGHCLSSDDRNGFGVRKIESALPVSSRAINTHNPIRNIVDQMKIEPNVEKSFIPLSIGDPTTFGNLPISCATKEALFDVIEKGNCHGYGPSDGFLVAKEAIAQFYSTDLYPLSTNDIILTSSCSGAIDLAIGAVAEEGTNILIPRPGFSIYESLTTLYNVNVKHYNLKPDKNWQIDLEHLEALVDPKTSAIVVCNPSNPCGSVWSRSHMISILKIAERHSLPIIADEIYADMVFSDVDYASFGQLSKNVPILIMGGMAKRWLVPGWRIGWILIQDRHNKLTYVRKGLKNLSQRILGPNSLCQLAIPKILNETSDVFYENVMRKLEKNAKFAFKILSKCPGLKPVMPSGAMYMMVGIDTSKFGKDMNDLTFTQDLVKEQSVFCLPGSCFHYPNYFRIVLTVPPEMMEEACVRIDEFCRDKLE
ncbi:tyrosine aminotransferase-like [Symsagittifera roscoffensis]|uniref:tyrosine aminotransferase-like n=1 Tax=Symsagittifera roscoffensis TaxID=84072 RepID=UPI00307CA13D